MVKVFLTIMCLFIATVADGTQVDTLLLWGSKRGQHKSDVQMHIFKPENPNGVGVIVCPGGSYFWLDERGEGDDVGKWLSSNGITAFVLFYRTAGALEFVWHTRTVFRGVRYPDMITDVQKALDWVRNRADEYKMAQDRIGLMGFSAGGHLVMSSACFHKTHFIEDNADTELRSNLRPDFVAAIYPVVTMNAPYVHRRSRRGLLGDSRQGNRVMRDSLSLERHIPSDCPPVFIVNCKDDPVVHYMNSVLLDSALTARGVGHKYLRYDTGKHGFGVSDYYGSPESRQWKNEFLEWLKEQMN